jgi:hypothetical protein
MKSTLGKAGTAASARYLMAAANTNADTITIVSLCAIAVLAMLHLMLRFPELGAVIESYNKF